MTPDEIVQLKSLFLEAIDRPPAQRAAWIAAQPRLSVAVRERLLAQLRRYDTEPDLAPAAEAARHESLAAEVERAFADPQTIGSYRVLRRLGEGGMGIVYACEQTEPVRRQVAVKRLKAGMDSEAIARRFEAERQALARMGHPAIAHVFDGGVDAGGRPYFAMELIDGAPITRYADDRRLSVDERVRMFIVLCHGVEHAHRRGVLHRDLKPANVLVTEIDGAAAPKIIDFGIAKAVGWSPGVESIHTLHGAVLGTPDYMSPEQATAGTVDLDTRSDVYALGVMLYELLTGVLPYDDATRQAVDDPAPPSARFRGTARETEHRASGRRATATSLHRQLRQELDWIVLCALQRDRDRRYDSVGAMARDLERYLAHEPVSARPPTLAYRLRRGLRRHRFLVISAAAIAVSLILGAVFAVHYAIDSARSREAAEDNLVDAYDVLSRNVALARFHRRPIADLARLQELQVRFLSTFDPDFEATRAQVNDRRLTTGDNSRALHRWNAYLIELAERSPDRADRVIADILHSNALVGFLWDSLEPVVQAAEAECALRANDPARFDDRELYARLLTLDILLAQGRERDVLTRLQRFRSLPADTTDDLARARFRARIGAALVARARDADAVSERDRLLAEAEQELASAQRWLQAYEPTTRGAMAADAAWIELHALRGEPERADAALQRLRRAVGERDDLRRYARTAMGFGPGAAALWEAVEALSTTAPGSTPERAAAFADLLSVTRTHRIRDEDPRWQPVLGPLSIAANLYWNRGQDPTTIELVALADRLASRHREICGVALQRAAFLQSLSYLHQGRPAEAEERARIAVSIPAPPFSVEFHAYALHQWGWCLARLGRYEEGIDRIVEGWMRCSDQVSQFFVETINAACELATTSVTWLQADPDAARPVIAAAEASIANGYEPRFRVSVDARMAWAAAQLFDRDEVLERAGRMLREGGLGWRFACWLGEALSRVGELERAIECFELAVRDAAQMPADYRVRTWCLTGAAYFRHGRYEAARTSFTRAAELSPDHSIVRAGLAALRGLGAEPERIELDGMRVPAFAARRLRGDTGLLRAGEWTSRRRDAYDTSDIGTVWVVYLRALVRHERLAEARELCERLVADPFRGPDTREGVARFLATTAGLSAADRQRGLEMARALSEQTRGNSARIEATLAEAELATGARDAAIGRLQRLAAGLGQRSAEWMTRDEVERRLERLGR